jgi:hypothetical protein
MDNAQLIIGVIAAIGGGLSACIFAWLGWHRDHPWLALAGTIASSAAMLCGTVAAAGAAKWAYGVGAGLAGLAFLLLPCRYLWHIRQELKQERRRGDALMMWMPEGTIEGESFAQSLSVEGWNGCLDPFRLHSAATEESIHHVSRTYQSYPCSGSLPHVPSSARS